MTYKLQIWYRYTLAGEQEKDFEKYVTVADSLEDAVKKGLAFYNTNYQIPFAVYHDDKKIDLETFTYKEEI